MFVFMNMHIRLARLVSEVMLVMAIVVPVRMRMRHRCVRVQVHVFLASEQTSCESHKHQRGEEWPGGEFAKDSQGERNADEGRKAKQDSSSGCTDSTQ